MSDTTKKEVINDFYDHAALLTTGVVGVSYVAKTVVGKSLGAPMTFESAMKLSLAVAGSSFAVAYLKDKGYVPKVIERIQEEIKRHNHALEELAEAKEKFYESEVKRRNQELRRRQEILDANHDIEETNKALDELKNYTRKMDLSAPNRKPKLSDYYQPSDDMQKYMYVTVNVVGLGGGYVLTRVF
ncbi:Hypothetical predicted protein [Paramuricea clavata]|uniref:Uncharacterized protein n=1 Tax=Paramuricea clavata TaxID=317549 RepID=A0A6S7FIN2_PARCT|nr:Hypothetical predicted protein [Paramuricea clavata]